MSKGKWHTGPDGARYWTRDGKPLERKNFGVNMNTNNLGPSKNERYQTNFNPYKVALFALNTDRNKAEVAKAKASQQKAQASAKAAYNASLLADLTQSIGTSAKSPINLYSGLRQASEKQKAASAAELRRKEKIAREEARQAEREVNQLDAIQKIADKKINETVEKAAEVGIDVRSEVDQQPPVLASEPEILPVEPEKKFPVGLAVGAAAALGFFVFFMTRKQK